MPAPRLLPDNATLQHWVEDEGLTHAEIAERVLQQTGHTVTRSSISAALSRAGLTKQGNRYTAEIPWRVEVKHIREYQARMLRLLGRRNAGLTLKDYEEERLGAWLGMLEENHAVVAYDSTSHFGFQYVEKRDDIDGLDGIPIRVQEVRVN